MTKKQREKAMRKKAGEKCEKKSMVINKLMKESNNKMQQEEQ